MYNKKIIFPFIILLLVSCSGLKRPTNIIRTSTETEIADLNVDFYPESIVVSPDVRHIAYAEDVYSGVRIVVDTVAHERYDDIGSVITFNPSCNSVAYFVYHIGYAGGIFGLFARDPYWEVIESNRTYGPYINLLNKSLVFSPDGKHIAYSVMYGYSAMVYYDHTELPDNVPHGDSTVDSVYIADVYPPFHFSPDSKKFAYVAEVLEHDTDNSRYSVIVNNNANKSYYDIFPHSLTFSPNSEKLAYVVKDSIHERVVVNEEELAAYEAIAESTLQFSPDSEHLAYAAFEDEGWYVVRDEIKSTSYDDIGQILFSPDGKHLAYSAQDGEDWIVMLDKKEISRHTALIEKSLAFSPDSKHLVYAVAADTGIVIYEDAKPIASYEALVTTPIFSPDGKYLVYTVGDNTSQAVVVNGMKGQPYPAIISHNGGRVVFDDANSIHYLAVKDDNKVYLVEEQF
ncbi:MAG TPA: hypothetical protein ENG70_04020 [Candidatus Cloacimonetes bacterium]|nr:hypothetical protein [Candidatus Cloacimonadota bacterium]HEX38009.1 hypothetical protein [Candidatus Cloacimonadota bacterium]